MVPDLGRVVEDTARRSLDDLFQGFALERRVRNEAIEFVDIGLVVLAVVIFERFGRNMRSQCVLRVRQGGSSKAMGEISYFNPVGICGVQRRPPRGPGEARLQLEHGDPVLQTTHFDTRATPSPRGSDRENRHDRNAPPLTRA